MPTDLIKVIQSREVEVAKDPERLRREAVSYLGQIKQHKSDPAKIYLLIDPLSSSSVLVEFKTADILYAENYNTLSDAQGGSVQLIQLWVKKGAVGLRLVPFVVEDFSRYYDHLD
ncbi:MAG: hypothetical protein RRB13_06195 [bacterium]|nr:hypothetical protein [bacterium]